MANTKYIVEVSYQRVGDITVSAESPEAAWREAKVMARRYPDRIKSPTIDCDALVVNDEHGELIMEVE